MAVRGGMRAAVLQLNNVHAGYGPSRVLHGVTLAVGEGEIVSLLGRNGAGRSTVLKAVMGLAQASGSARFRGQELIGRQPFEIARLGVGYVPEGRQVFPALTVHQNLILGRQKRRPSRRWPLDRLYEVFAPLRLRQHTAAGVLSGGEQQLLALARTLAGEPELILIDEPAEGLAPKMAQQVAGLLEDFKRQGVSVLLVEQKLAIALEVSDRLLVMGRGRIVFEGTPAAWHQADAVRRQWLEV